MRLSRNSALVLLALCIVLALGAGVAFGTSRSLQMATAERDFQERVRNSGEYARLTQRLKARGDELDEIADGQSELDDWYAAAGPGEASAAEGSDPVTASTAPVDESHLVNDARPFGAPMIDTGSSTKKPTPALEGEGGPQAAPPGW